MKVRKPNRRPLSQKQLRSSFFGGLRRQPAFSSRSLQFEALEDRRVMAYAVTTVGGVVTFTGDATADTLTLGVVGGNLSHNRFAAGDPGFQSNEDMISGNGTDDIIAVTAITSLVVSDVGNNDTLTLATTALNLTNAAATFSASGYTSITDVADFSVTNLASFSALGPITLGGAAQVTNFGSLNFNSSGAVTIQEDSATGLAGANTALSLALTSAGAITDSSTSLAVTNLASFNGTAITIGGASTTNLGTLTFNSAGAVSIQEDSATGLAGANTALSLALTSTGAITDSSTSLAVTNLASFNGTAITIGGASTTNLGTLTFNSAGAVSIQEDSATGLAGANTALSLALTSTGAITDSSTSLAVTNLASFNGTAITIGGASTTNLGTLTFNSAGAVSIQEDSATGLAGANTALSLALTSTGAITDSSTSLAVTNLANFNGTAITIGGGATTTNLGTLTFNSAGAVSIQEDSATDLAGVNTALSLDLTSTGAITDSSTSLAVTNLATFNGTAITIGGGATTTNLGTLTFNSAGAVTIQEDSATTLAGANTAASLLLTSAGAIDDGAAATLNVGVNANFQAAANAITLDNAAAHNFGSLTFAGGTVVVIENSATALAGTSTGTAITLTSAGAITDAEADASNEINGTSLLLTAVGGIGAAAATSRIQINVTTLDVNNSVGGGIFVTDTAGGLTLGNLGGPNGNAVNGVGGAGEIRANSPLLIAADAITTGGMTYTAVDSAAVGDDITLSASVDVTDSTGALILNVGDNLEMDPTSTITGQTGLTINLDATSGGVVDPIGSTTILDGLVSSVTGTITVNGFTEADSLTIASSLNTVENIGANLLFNGGGGAGIDSLTLNDSGDASGDGTVATPVTISSAGAGAGTIARLIDANPARTIAFAGLVLNSTVSIQFGNVAADTVQVTPNANVIYNLDGNLPATIPGDHLIYSGPNPATKTITGVGAGSITAGGVQPVNFADFEQISAAPPGNLLNDVIDLSSAPLIALGSQDGLRNNVRVQRSADGTLLQIFFDSDASTPAGEVLLSSQLYTSVGTLTVTGGTDEDTLIVNHSNGLIGKIINFNGNAPVNAGEPAGDALSIVGTPTGGLGAAAREIYQVGATEDAGTWTIDPNGVPASGDEMVVNFTGLEPADSDTIVPQFDVVYDAADADNISIVNGGLLNGAQSILVTDVGGTFESFRFANKTLVRLHLNGGADNIDVNYTIAAAALTTLEVYGNGVAAFPGVGADDNSADTFVLRGTAAGVTTSLFGQGGSDVFRHLGSDGGNLGNLSGTINITGGETAADNDHVALLDSNSAGPDTVLLTATQLTGAAPATINYTEVENFFFESTAGNDTINVTSTVADTSYFITGNGGNDTYTVGNTAAGFATPGTGSLDAIQGEIIFSGEFNGAAGTDTLNVDDSGTAALNDSATIDTVAAFPALATPGAPRIGDATVLTNFAPAPIRYYHGTFTAVPGNAIENLNILGSTGSDVIAVNATSATIATVINTRQGDDTVTINGDRLSANNTFQGFDGNDQTILNITAHIGQTPVTAAIASVIIEGNANPVVDSNNRDRLTINDVTNVFARNLNYDYLDTAGDLDLGATVAGAGLFGGNGVGSLALNVRTMETLIFNGEANNDDVTLVTGTTADDDLTVALRKNDNAALVFINGNPYDIAPPDSLAGNLPGIAGTTGRTGPDISISGLDNVFGITLDGSGVTTPGAENAGNRAIVQTASEADITVPGGTLDIFGFGVGVLIPGFGVGNAYDTVSVNGAGVDIPFPPFFFDSNPNQVVTYNNGVGGFLVPVAVLPGSFVNGVLPAARAGLIVNGGDEAVAQPNGVADDFYVQAHPQFNIGINGNLPLLGPLAPDGFPAGDQLNLFSPTSFSIWSDKATPPNVSIFAGNNPFGVINSSIERTRLFPGNGTVNLIGDNNDAAVDQTDNFVVTGIDIDSGFADDAGYQEMSVVINGSAPILIDGVNKLNVYGYDLVGQNLDNPIANPPDNPATGDTADDIDTLEITAYADNAGNTPNNAPRGWGIDVLFNEGSPAAADGDQSDLLIYHTSQGLGGGGSVSEDIAIQPSGPDNGELRATNAVDGSVIVVIAFINNTDIIVLDDDGALTDNDSLTLRGTNPNALQTSGNETFDINADAEQTLADPFVTVTDTDSGAILYRLRGFVPSVGMAPPAPIQTIRFDGLAGDDIFDVAGTTVGLAPFFANTQAYFIGGEGDDSLNIDLGDGVKFSGTGLFYDGGSGVDTLSVTNSVALVSPITDTIYTPGPALGAGQLTYQDGVNADMVIDFVGLEPVLDTVASANLTVNANNASNAINYGVGSVVANGLISIDDHETIEFSNKTNLVINALAGSDTINLNNPNTPTALTAITVNGGDPTGSDRLIFNATTAADAAVYTPLTADSATLTGVGPSVTVNTTESITFNGQGGADTLAINGTALDDTFTINPANGGAGSHASNAAPAFNYLQVPDVTIDGAAGGFDLAIVNGTEAADVFTSAAAALLLTGGGTTTFGASIERLDLNLLGGDDSTDLTLLTAVPATTIYAGNGNDIIIASPGADLIFGGSGNDTLTGGAGADEIYGEAGNDSIIGGVGIDRMHGGDDFDTFTWNPGDGSDFIDGGDDEADILIFNGSAGADAFQLQPAGNSTHNNVILGAATVDTHGVEQINVNGLAGADTFTVADLFATEVKAINLNLGVEAGVADAVTINGRNVSDNVNITGVSATRVAVTGLRYDVNIDNALATDLDAFTFLANGGNDVVVATDSLATFFPSTNNPTVGVGQTNFFTISGGDGDDFLSGYGRLNGDAGNDTLSGSVTLVGVSSNQVLDGGAGDDQLFGGNGDDLLLGGADEDLMVGGLGTDTYDGGADFDTILVQGTSGADRIDYRQNSPTQIQYEVSNFFTPGVDGVVGGVGTETDTLVVTGGVRTVEEVRLVAGSGDDLLRVTQADSLIANGEQALSLQVTVDGGSPGASDRLTVVDDGLGDTTIQRIGGTAGEGSFTIGALAPIVYNDVEYASLTPLDPVLGGTGTDGLGKLFVFKYDPFESNNSRLNATFLGANSAINLDPVIDPGADALFGASGDEDWYRIVAEKTGTLDIRVYFDLQGDLDNGRDGLPGNGDLDIALYDADGVNAPNVAAPIAGTGVFGTNDATDDERIRIPAVEGQTYYLRVRGASIAANPGASTSAAVNVYNVSVLNTPAPKPFDLELEDIVGTGTVAVPAGNVFTANNPAAPEFQLSTVDGFYVGKYLTFTSGAGVVGLRTTITGYVGATRQFTIAPGTIAGPIPVGATFQVESVDTGRSQFDNITRDDTPTIYIRVPDSALLNDIPDNGTLPSGFSADDTVLIPFVVDTATNVPDAPAAGVRSGFRVAIFVSENDTHNPVPAGYAQPVAGRPGVYSYTFTTPLDPDSSYFISSRVEMIDPALPEQAQGFGEFSQSLEIVVDTVAPPIFFGLPNDPDDGLHPDSDTGFNTNTETLNDGITSDTTPTFFGQAEANAVIRLYVDAPEPGFPNGNGIFNPTIDFQIGMTVAVPNDGTNQYPDGYWEATSNVDLNAPPFAQDGLRTIFATAEDVAGNINPADGLATTLSIVLDTQGPQITGVFIADTTLIGLQSGTNTLVRFSSADPTTVLATTPITGLVAGDVVVGIDLRPSTNQLYAVARNGAVTRLYVVNPLTGAAGAPIVLTADPGDVSNPFAGALIGNNFGVDFNPVVDRLRITSDGEQNLRVNVTTGLVITDADLNPAGNVEATAYTNNQAGPGSAAPLSTVLYNIDSTSNRLVRQDPPNAGVLVDVGPLGVDPSAVVGFDVAAGTNRGFAVMTVGGVTRLYSIDLNTGAATALGNVGTGAIPLTGVTALAPYDLFDPKPSTDGPTPLVNSIFIALRDLPPRVQGDLYAAIKADIADNPGHYLVQGDYNGIIPIVDVIVNAPVPADPGPLPASVVATATIELVFRLPGPDGVFNTADDIGKPLPDDRFTLTVSDNGVFDPVGNQLDGENNSPEPQEAPQFPTGDGLPGGSFAARFTVDSRPEIGTWASGSVYIDTNGNTNYDPNNLDFTNRDISYLFAFTSDTIFAGNFTSSATGIADGFDKLAAYGRVGTTTYRWLIDTDNDGVPDINQVEPGAINAFPVAGNFDLSLAGGNGDEVGLFNGTTWFFDTDHDFSVSDVGGSKTLAWPTQGYPIVGDFDGDGIDDLGTFRDDLFSIDLSSVNDPGKADVFPGIDGTVNVTFRLNVGIIGAGDRPVVADMNMDGFDDIGLWIPRQSGSDPNVQSEFYFLVSGVVANDVAGPGNPPVGALLGPAITSRIVTDPRDGLKTVSFQPTPFGNDLRIGFGDEFALPIIGNFDPPATLSGAGGTHTNPNNELDVDNDGYITALDALIVINELNSKGSVQLSGPVTAPFIDVDADGYLSPSDTLRIINWLNTHGGSANFGQSAGEGEGEGSADAYFAELGSDAAWLLGTEWDASGRKRK